MVLGDGLAGGNHENAARELNYELDLLANKGFQYITKKYLPRKLKKKDWLD